MTQDRFSKSPKSRPMVGKCGGDDGLIEGGEKHAQHQAVEDIAHVRLAQRRMRCGVGKLVRLRLEGVIRIY